MFNRGFAVTSLRFASVAVPAFTAPSWDCKQTTDRKDRMKGTSSSCDCLHLHPTAQQQCPMMCKKTLCFAKLEPPKMAGELSVAGDDVTVPRHPGPPSLLQRKLS